MEFLQNKQAKSFFYLLMAITFFAVFRVFRPYLGVIFFAIVIVITFGSVYHRIEERLGRFRAWASPVTILVVLLTLLVPLTILLLLTLNELAWMIEDLLIWASGTNVDEITDDTTLTFDFNQLLDKLNMALASYGVPKTYLLSYDQIITFIQTRTSSFASSAQTYLSTIGGNATAFITKAIVFFSLLAVLFPNMDKMLDYLKELSPLDDNLDQIYIDRMIGMSRDMFRGIVVIAVVQGVATGILFFLLGVPYVILWTIVATFLSLIPIGTAFVFVPATIIFLLLGFFFEAAVVLIIGMLVIGNLDTVMRSRLVSEENTIDSTLVLIGALGGLALFGLLGVVYGPVLVIIFLTTLEIYRVHYSPTAEAKIKEKTAQAIEQAEQGVSAAAEGAEK